MFAVIITDCRDDNAMSRQKTRLATLLTSQVAITGVGVQSDLEAAGCLVDTMDAANQAPGVVLVNVAPRNAAVQKKWSNGSPFAYFWHGQTLVVSSIDGLTLSMVKKLGLIRKVRLMDIEKVVASPTWKERWGNQQERIIKTQFRSYEFLPRVASLLLEGQNVPSKKHALAATKLPPLAIWSIDCFGNCKTTLLPQEVSFKRGEAIETSFGILSCFTQLRSVPDNEAAIVVGSSGIQNQRFLEIVIQGGRAADYFNISVGTSIF